jgi:hypothetical protein
LSRVRRHVTAFDPSRQTQSCVQVREGRQLVVCENSESLSIFAINVRRVASAARIFGWDKTDKPGVQLNQQIVISAEQLEQIRQLRNA